MIADLIALLLCSRDRAHKFHWSTGSYAAHKALETFYTDLLEQTDELVEVCQGRCGHVLTIPVLDCEEFLDPIAMLETHLKLLEGLRYEAVPREDTPIHNLIDGVAATYIRALYKLRQLH